jgi:hypothetical protein
VRKKDRRERKRERKLGKRRNNIKASRTKGANKEGVGGLRLFLHGPAPGDDPKNQKFTRRIQSSAFENTSRYNTPARILTDYP